MQRAGDTAYRGVADAEAAGDAVQVGRDEPGRAVHAAKEVVHEELVQVLGKRAWATRASTGRVVH